MSAEIDPKLLDALCKKQNVEPGLLGCDPALVPRGGGGYNILADTYSAPSAH